MGKQEILYLLQYSSEDLEVILARAILSLAPEARQRITERLAETLDNMAEVGLGSLCKRSGYPIATCRYFGKACKAICEA